MNPPQKPEREDLVAYLDGELGGTAARSVEARLQADPAIRAEAEALKRTWDLLDYLPRPQPSAAFTHQTLERVAALQTGGTSWRQRLRWRYSLAWAASVLLAGAVGYWGGGGLAHWTNRGAGHVEVDPQMVRDARVIENLPLYEPVKDFDFLQKLANPNDPDLFGDDREGT